MYFARSLSTLIAFASIVTAQKPSAPAENNSYLFLAGKVSAQLKNDFVRVQSFDGKKFQLTGSEKTLRANKPLPATLQPVMVVSKFYASVDDLEYNFSDTSGELKNLLAINAVEKQQMRYEAAVDVQNFRQGLVTTRPPVTDASKAAMALNAETREHVEKKLRGWGDSRLIDTLQGASKIVANRNVTNAYAALVLKLDQQVKNLNEPNRHTFVRIVGVGDLDAGAPKTFKFRTSFPRLEASFGELEIFLFDGSGKYVATNRSRGLRELNPQQLKELRELEMNNRAERASSKN